MSNRFWGWGREDDEFYRRITGAGLQVPRLTPPTPALGRLLCPQPSPWGSEMAFLVLPPALPQPAHLFCTMGTQAPACGLWPVAGSGA